MKKLLFGILLSSSLLLCASVMGASKAPSAQAMEIEEDQEESKEAKRPMAPPRDLARVDESKLSASHQFLRGCFYEEKDEHDHAVALYKMAADKGYTPAMGRLANYFYLGLVVEQDLEETVSLLEQAAKSDKGAEIVTFCQTELEIFSQDNDYLDADNKRLIIELLALAFGTYRNVTASHMLCKCCKSKAFMAGYKQQ